MFSLFSFSLNKSIALVAVLLLLLFIAIVPLAKETPLLANIATSQAVPTLTLPQFVDVTASSGLLIEHSQRGDTLSALDETLGAGACAFDYDNDHWIDLLVIAGSGQNHFYGKQEWWQEKSSYVLFRNLGNGKFQNVTQQAGLLANEWGMGCNTADLDNDGDQDIVISNKGNNKLYRNNGDGTFVDVSEAAGFSGKAWSTSISIADYDQDGYLDIYIGNYIDLKKGANTFERMKGYNSLLAASFDATLYDAQANQLYRNRGNLTFSEMSEELKIANASGRTLAAYWLDSNNDHYPELWLANDQGSANPVYLNKQGKGFQDISATLNTALVARTAAVSSGDTNNDGIIDIGMTTGSQHPFVLYQREQHATMQVAPVYQDKSRSLGLANKANIAAYQWGMVMQDFNHNGRLDIMAASGYTTPDMGNPKIAQGQPNTLWLNQGHGSFQPCVNACGDALQDAFSSRAIVSADFDNDGDIDVYLTNNNEAGQLLFNQTMSADSVKLSSATQHWLAIKLQAKQGNRDALGSIVRLKVGEQRYMRRVDGATSFLSSGAKRLHFGVGKHQKIDEISIEWPSGVIQYLHHIPSDRYLVITEGEKHYQTIDTKTLVEKKKDEKKVSPLLNDTQSTEQQLLVLKDVLAKDKHHSLGTAWLEKLAKHPQATIRRNVLQLAFVSKTANAFALAIDGLADQDETVRLVAIEKLRDYEAEFSVRYLLRLFADKRPAVRCAVTNAFAFFFKEEEAVINKKYLALPAIIRQLKDPVAEVRQCAALALGEAESYRAVQPLIQRLNDEEIMVKLAAIDALGLIRQRHAIPALFTLLDQAQHAAVLSHTLMALKRLNAAPQAVLLARPLKNKTLHNDVEAIGIIFSAYEQLVKEGVILHSHAIAQATWQWFSSQNNEDIVKQKVLFPALQHMLTIIRLASYQEGISLASRLLESDDVAMKQKAYHTLVSFRKPEKFTAAESAVLESMPLTLRKLVYQHALELPLAIPFTLLKKEFAVAELQQPIIALLAKYPTVEAKSLLLEVIGHTENALSLRRLALRSFSASILPRVKLPLAVYRDKALSMRKGAIAYWTKKQQKRPFIANMPAEIKVALADKDPEVHLLAIMSLVTRSEQWAIHAWQNDLYNKTASLTHRIKIVEALPQKTWQEEKVRLLAILHDKKDPLSAHLLALFISR